MVTQMYRVISMTLSWVASVVNMELSNVRIQLINLYQRPCILLHLLLWADLYLTHLALGFVLLSEIVKNFRGSHTNLRLLRPLIHLLELVKSFMCVCIHALFHHVLLNRVKFLTNQAEVLLNCHGKLVIELMPMNDIEVLLSLEPVEVSTWCSRQVLLHVRLGLCYSHRNLLSLNQFCMRLWGGINLLSIVHHVLFLLGILYDDFEVKIMNRCIILALNWMSSSFPFSMFNTKVLVALFSDVVFDIKHGLSTHFSNGKLIAIHFVRRVNLAQRLRISSSKRIIHKHFLRSLIEVFKVMVDWSTLLKFTWLHWGVLLRMMVGLSSVWPCKVREDFRTAEHLLKLITFVHEVIDYLFGWLVDADELIHILKE